MLIHELFASGRARNPDHPFLVFDGETFSYDDFETRIGRTAAALDACGVAPGDRVCVYLDNRPAFLALFFASSRLGTVLAPANPAYTERELAHSLSLSEPRLLITTADGLETARGAARDTTVEEVRTVDTGDRDTDLHALADGHTAVEPVDQAADSPALHMYTSGTTGPPKAVEVSHRNYTVAASDFAKRMGFAPSDRLATALPLFHANAQVYTTLGACAAGATVVLFEDFSASAWWERMRATDVTEFNAMGSMLKMLDAADPEEGDNPVELVFSAGTPPDLIEPFEERFGLRVVEGYSLTEDVLLILNPTTPSRRKIGSIGLPPAEKRVRIVDDDGDPVRRGEAGEIVMRCPSLMRGYYGQPDKTVEAVRDGWFHTGDVGRMDEEGFVYFLDRKKDVVRRSGENVSSFEVEGVIKAIEGVEEVAVIPVEDDVRGEEVKALVRRAPDARITPAEVVEAASESLAPFKRPRYVEFVEEFPYTPTEKIQKAKLREREREGDTDHWDREAR